jgi:hypothetical protein
MFGFFCAVWATAGAHRAATTTKARTLVSVLFIAFLLPCGPNSPGPRLADRAYSNAKIFFQSFFMLMTVQPFFFASSYNAWVKVPTLVSRRPCAGP